MKITQIILKKNKKEIKIILLNEKLLIKKK